MYGHFDILMSQYTHMNKNHSIQAYAKILFWLQTAKTENPNSPQRCPSTSGCPEYHSDTPKHPSDTLQTPPSHLQLTHNTNRRQQTPPDKLKRHCSRCPRVSGGVCWHLLSSNGILSSLEMSGGVWGVYDGCLGVSEWNSWKSAALGFV